MRIDFNLFVVFDTIYREGSLTSAAKILHLTQPAVSHALAKLREQFDDELFVRQGKQMLPTPTAKAAIHDVREAIALLRNSMQKARGFDPEHSERRFSISINDVLEAAFLPQLMQRLQQESHGLSLHCQKTPRRELVNQLANGSIDAAFDVYVPSGEQIKSRRIYSDRYLVVARNNHPLLRKIRGKKKLDQQNYLEAHHVVVSSRSRGISVEDYELSRLGLQRKIGLRCQNYLAACWVVEQSDMLLTLPESIAGSLNQNLNTQLLAMPVELPALDIYLYWHQSMEDDPANRWLLEQLFAMVEQLD